MSKLDSRLSGATGIAVTHPTLPLERTYCHMCGCLKGWTSTDSFASIAPDHVLVVCDPCDAVYGHLPLPELDIEEF